MEHSVSKSPINMVVRVTKLDTKEAAWAGTGEKGAQNSFQIGKKSIEQMEM